MQYMLIFQEPMSEFSRRTDPATATTHWAAWGAYIVALGESGAIINGHGLLAPQMGTTIRVRDGKRMVQDGPYADAKEHLGGYFVIDVPSLDVALAWAEKAPSATTGSVEVRPVMPPVTQGMKP